MKEKNSNYTIYDYFVMAIIVSFLGFFLEDLWIALHEGYVDNRNMYLPFLIGYGMAIISISIVIGIPDNKHLLSYFSKIFLAISIGEFVLGTIVEKTCGIYFWDYTSLPLHFTRYTSFFTSLAFSAIITLFMWKVFCPLMDIIHSHDSRSMRIVSTIAITLLLLDLVFSFVYMYNNQSFHDNWRFDIPYNLHLTSLFN